MNKRVSRRNFLGTSAAAGFWIASWKPAESRSPNEKLNIAAIGVGGQGNSDLDQLKSQNIVALCDADQSALDRTAAKFPGAAQHRDFRKMLDPITCTPMRPRWRCGRGSTSIARSR